MNERDIDNISRAAFPPQDFSFEEKYWNGLATKLDAKSGKKRIIFWWGAGLTSLLILAVSLSTWYSFFKVEEAERSSTKKVISTNSNKTSSTLNAETAPSTNLSYSSTNEKEDGMKPSVINERVKTEKVSTGEEILLDSKPDHAQKMADATPNSEFLLDKADMAEESDASNTPVLPNDSVVKKNNLPVIPNEMGSDVEANENTSHEGTSHLVDKSNNADGILENPEQKMAVETVLHTEVSNDSNPKIVDEMLNGIIDSVVEATPPPEPIETEFGEHIPSKKISKFYLEAMGAFLIDKKQNIPSVLKNTMPLESSFERNFSKQMMGGMNAGLKVNHIFVQTGLYLQQVHEVYSISLNSSYTKKETQISDELVMDRIDSTFVRHEIVRVPKGSDVGFQIANTIYEQDTIWKTEHDTTVTEHVINESKSDVLNQRISYIRIPFVVGYEYQFKKFLVAASVGLETGIIVKSQLSIYDSKSESVLSLSQNEGLNSVTLAYNLNLGIGYYFSENWSLRIRPTFMQSIIAPYKDQNQYRGYGLRLGMRYQF